MSAEIFTRPVNHEGGNMLFGAALLILFLLGYMLIATEHYTKIDKGATALLLGFGLFALIALFGPFSHEVVEKHLHNLTGEIAQIILFLLGAMAIVEMISLCGGFDVIARKITSKSKRKLLFVVATITFGMSALLDNLTTSIVMYAVTCKLIDDTADRMTFGGIIVIAANSGGAWFPTGDVTTTMLWIAGKITTVSLIKHLFIPSLISLLVPLVWVMRGIDGKVEKKTETKSQERKGALLILTVGVVGLLSVPILKATLHLPPYLCILGALGILWTLEEIMYKGKAWITISQSEEVGSGDDSRVDQKNTLAKALESVEVPSLLFFIGILLAVGALQSVDILQQGAAILTRYCSPNVVVALLGILSAILDNVPLTAASIQMYQNIPADSLFWHMLALCVGTGGSLLIIGSAAGVVLMGKARITFGWYLRRFTLPVLGGYLAALTTLILLN